MSFIRLSIICWMFAYCASISNAFVPISMKCRIKSTLTDKRSHFFVRRDLYKVFGSRSQTTINESMIFVSSSTSIPKEEKENTSENSNNNENVNDAARWRAEAARIRLDAEKMEVSLLLEKIKAMEDKLNNPKWVMKHSLDDIENMERQLEQLKQKLFPDTDGTTKIDNTKKEFIESRSHISDNNDKRKKDHSFFNLNRFFNSNGRDDVANKNDNGDKLRGTSSSGHILTQSLQVSSKSAVARSRSQQHSSSQVTTTTTTENKQNNKISTTSNELEIPGVTITQDANKTDSITILLDPISFGSSNDASKNSNRDSRITRVEEKRDLSGFDPNDLELYLPIALNIEKTMINATDNEKLYAFRSYPDLQQHFQMKITSLLIQPLKDIQEMESLKKQYLMSSSRTEKESLKRRIDRLQQYITDDNNEFSLYSDTIHLKDLKPISDIEMKSRINALTNLPNVLQTLYKKRGNLEYNDTIELAIEFDYYEQQLQLLEQIKYIKKASTIEEENEIKNDIILAIESIPIRTRNYIAKNKFGLDTINVTVGDLFQQYSNYRELENDEEDYDDDAIDITDLIKESSMKPSSMIMEKKKSDEKMFKQNRLRSLLKNGLTLQSLKKENNKFADLDLPEYNDIGFIDRSRYIEEFYPSIARMEGQHPSIEEMNDFVQNVIEKKNFMLSNKPERVIGGWYIRGRNLLSEYDGSNSEASTMLVESLQNSLRSSKYKDSLQFFYIPDPSPLTDEDFEMDYTSEPILVVTSKNDPNTFYNYSSGITKTIITTLGLISILLVAIGATILQPGIQSQLYEITTTATGDITAIDLVFFTDTFTQIALSILSIQLSHELGHRIVAWKDKFRLGIPTFMPSIQLGLLGAITPFNTPPPSLKSMFDVGIAGPLFGLIVSLGYLLAGLDITSHMSMDQLSGLPVFPSYLLRSSELGGSLIEYYLGKGTVTQQSDLETLIPLHPYAIAGSVGIISNALALLPLGNTDGGRIAVAMFGRRGAYIVKTFTAVLLCAIGLFWFAESRPLLAYVFIAQVWQRELETPALNEVDELDFPRGALGIVTALIVALALVPMV